MARKQDKDLVEVVHRVAGEPRRGGPDDDTLFWNELKPDGSVRIMFWTPDDAADRQRLERFWQACQELDWDDGSVHEVVMLEPQRRWSMPTPPAALDPARPPRAPFKFAPSGLVRRGDRPPASVAESWRRIETWAYEHCPEVLVQLRPGASARDLARLAKVIGRPLPADLRESMQIHDGMGPIPEEYADLVRGEDDDAPDPSFLRRLIYEYRLEPLQGRPHETLLELWRRWAKAADEEREDDTMPSYFKLSSFPAQAIRIRFAFRGWIPVLSQGVNRSNYIGVDLDPGPTGVVGQVINFGRDEQQKYVLALSWGQFLEDYADELEAGHFVIEDDSEDRWLYLRTEAADPAARSPLFGKFREWAEAKLPPGFLTAKPPRKRPAARVDPAIEAACRAAVDGFVAAFHGWDARWINNFRLAELGFHALGYTRGVIQGTPARRLDELAGLGLPIPPGVAFEDSAASDDPARRAEFYEEQGIAARVEEAGAEFEAIFANHATAWNQERRRQREEHGRNYFVRAFCRYDPATYRVATVRRRDTETAEVTCEPKGDFLPRFRLKLEAGTWRVDQYQRVREGGKKVEKDDLWW